jgi:beta-glucanase (GH16 family)
MPGEQVNDGASGLSAGRGSRSKTKLAPIWRRFAIAAALASASLPTAQPAMSASAASTPIFCDDFNSLNRWDGRTGVWDAAYFWQHTPNGSTLPGEGEWYLDPAFAPTASVHTLTIANGALVITADRTPASIAAYTEGHHYVSGLINSGHGYSQKYGYFEMRAQLPRGRGLWPAFWLVPADMTASHEIDVMEVLGHDMRTLHTTLHTFAGGHIMQTETTAVADMSRGFHLYGADWQPDWITWYFDRRPVFRSRTPAFLNKPMFMIVDLAVGGPMPGPVDATTQFPARMTIDYIKTFASIPQVNDPAAERCPGTR